jgi:hypothetical protein
MRLKLIAFSALAVLGFAPAPARAQCTGVNHVTWPAVNPVWDFCWLRPSVSSLANGEGIRISSVKFQGVTILRDAHIPVLNVQYDAGGCGGSVLCYRDWFDQERAFTCAPTVSAGYCTGTTTAVNTVCNHPGTDAGTFSGVAVVDKGTSLKLTSEAQAGWYRYIATWEFYPDGSMTPGMEITAVNSSCVAFTHRHHAYWRLDFDLNGGTKNSVDLITPGGSQNISTETMFSDTLGNRSFWRVSASGTPVRVDVMRNPGDGSADGDAFARGDGWLLAYRNTEIDDGPHGQSQCPADLGNYLNGENVAGADVVLWVHAKLVHKGETGGQAHDCSIFGPTVRVNLTGAASTSVLSASGACAGQPLTVTATLTPASATGVVEFLDGGVSLGTAPLAGGVAAMAVANLLPGSHAYSAVYRGDGALLGNKSAVLNVTAAAATTEARGLTLSGGASTALQWQAPLADGGAAVDYDVLRAAQAGDFLSSVCLASDIAGSSATDAIPTSGFFLVRAENRCGGSLGSDSSGAPIAGRSCP